MQKVLMVDDSLIACRLIQIELSPFGYEVMTVDTVDGALLCLANHEVDAVMLDLSVAEALGGLPVVERLRATRPDGRLQVILHSALDEEELALRCGTLGADGVFRKGGRLVDLVQQLQHNTAR